MVNIDDFVKRLEIILDYYALNASSFADKIGVQRSSMSHLLSGRNKPSLDFVLKILDVFPEVDLYWILNGKGTFPKNEQETVIPKIENTVETEKQYTPTPNEKLISTELFSEMSYAKTENPQKINLAETKNSNFNSKEGEIEKIVFFYKNGTFKIYIP